MTKNITDNEEIKKLTLEIVKLQKPKSGEKLISLMKERYAIPPEKMNNILIELETEDLLHFLKSEPNIKTSAKAQIFSIKALWYWTTLIFSFVTILMVLLIPASDYPLVYLRYVFGFVFVLFLPGHTLTKLLFSTGLPRIVVFSTTHQILTSSHNFETIERFSLSVGLSLALLPMLGLILNYTPWGVRLVPITLSLLALTIVFATAAILREYQAKTHLQKLIPNS